MARTTMVASTAQPTRKKYHTPRRQLHRKQRHLSLRLPIGWPATCQIRISSSVHGSARPAAYSCSHLLVSAKPCSCSPWLLPSPMGQGSCIGPAPDQYGSCSSTV